MDFFLNSNAFYNRISALSPVFNILILLLLAWTFLWKGLGLWNTAKNNQKNWFVAILILNTIGILEIAYLFYFSKNPLKLKDIQLLLKQKPRS